MLESCVVVLLLFVEGRTGDVIDGGAAFFTGHTGSLLRCDARGMGWRVWNIFTAHRIEFFA